MVVITSGVSFTSNCWIFNEQERAWFTNISSNINVRCGGLGWLSLCSWMIKREKESLRIILTECCRNVWKHTLKWCMRVIFIDFECWGILVRTQRSLWGEMLDGLPLHGWCHGFVEVLGSGGSPRLGQWGSWLAGEGGILLARSWGKMSISLVMKAFCSVRQEANWWGEHLAYSLVE